MMRWKLHPDVIDRPVARAIVSRVRGPVEESVGWLTLAGDQRLLIPLTGFALILANARGGRRSRQCARDVSAALTATMALDHALKALIDERRPNRAAMALRHPAIPRSGKAHQAFPSGHALHAIAIGSALARAYPKTAGLIWTGAAVLAASRVVLLAHLLSDVVLGFGLGMGVERTLHRWRR